MKTPPSPLQTSLRNPAQVELEAKWDICLFCCLSPTATASCSWWVPRTAAHQSTPAWCSAAPASSPCPLARNQPSHPRQPTRWRAVGRRNMATAWSLIGSLLFPLAPSRSSTVGAASSSASPLLSHRLHSSSPSL